MIELQTNEHVVSICCSSVYPWFHFDFPLFFSMLIIYMLFYANNLYDNEYKTKLQLKQNWGNSFI